MKLIIPREYFLVFSKSSTLYALHGGIGATHGGVVVDGITLALSGRVDVGGKV